MSPWNFFGLFGGDAGITQTVNVIRKAVDWALHEDSIRRRAEALVAGCPEKDSACEVAQIFTWSRTHFRYVRDPRGIEFIKSPEISDAEISRQGFFQGDCDDIVAYMAALFKSIGYPVRAVVIALPGKGDDYRHIYLEVYAPGVAGASPWVALEGTALKPMGWQATGTRARRYDL